jgi:hypothetical protein
VPGRTRSARPAERGRARLTCPCRSC